MINNLDRIYTDDVAEFSRRYLGYLGEVLKAIDPDAISRFVDTLLEARERGAMVYFIGNGGSAPVISPTTYPLARILMTSRLRS